MTIFEIFFFFEGPEVKGQTFTPPPTKTPAYGNVYPRLSDSYRTSLASSRGFVSQLENSYGTYS